MDAEPAGRRRAASSLGPRTRALLLPPVRRRRLPQLRLDLRRMWARLAGSWLAIVQMIAAALGAYAIAHFLLGHPYPVLAVTVAISSLGFQRDARPLRVAETALGMVLGIAISEAILVWLGGGIGPLALALALVLALGRLLSPTPSFAVAAAVQAALVLVLPPPEGGAFLRTVDALVGGLLALLFTALVPRDPQRGAAVAARRVFATLADSLSSLAAAVELGDPRPARHALHAMRATQPLLDGWAVALESSIAVARISPLLRRQLPLLQEQEHMHQYADLACRNLRVVSRRVSTEIDEGQEPHAALAGVFAQLREAVELLGGSIVEPGRAVAAREAFQRVAARLTPALLGPEPHVADLGVLLTTRPLLVDLLSATGLEPEYARTLLPPLS